MSTPSIATMGGRRKRIDEWLRHELLLRFEGRVLSIDDTVADAWGRVVAHREALGRRNPTTARARGAWAGISP